MILTRFIYFYIKDLSKLKFEFLIKKHEDAGIKHLNDPKAFTECSNAMDDIYYNIDDYNPSRKIKVRIVFDDILQILWLIKNFKP